MSDMFKPCGVSMMAKSMKCDCKKQGSVKQGFTVSKGSVVALFYAGGPSFNITCLHVRMGNIVGSSGEVPLVSLDDTDLDRPMVKLSIRQI